MAGTISLSLSQQFDSYGKPLSGGQLYFIQAGTVATPQNAYQDTALTIPLPNPITLDAAGRVPQFFLADGQIKVRLQDRMGVVQLAADNILVIGPSAGGGGGGGAVDPTTVIQTGDLKVRYDVAIIAGFVRANGKTIGSATSGATELADPSAQALFQFLWGVDPSLPVTPSRGSNAVADWAANKQLALPDWRGCTIAGLDTMGAPAAGRLTATYFGVVATALGAMSGSESNLLAGAQIPAHQHPVLIDLHDPGHHHLYSGPATAVAGTPNTSIYGTISAQNTNDAVTNIVVHAQSALGLKDDQTATTGGGLPHANCQPTKLCTIYIKL